MDKAYLLCPAILREPTNSLKSCEFTLQRFCEAHPWGGLNEGVATPLCYDDTRRSSLQGMLHIPRLGFWTGREVLADFIFLLISEMKTLPAEFYRPSFVGLSSDKPCARTVEPESDSQAPRA